MTRRTRSNPAWSDQIAHKNCDAIQAACKEFRLPMPLLDDGCKIEGELGHGLYGAVYETESPDVIFKLTSDPSEAHLIGLLIAMREKDGFDADGIARFDAIFGLKEKYEKNPTFAVWREAAKSTGLRVSDSCEMKEFARKLSAYKDRADEAFFIALEAAENMPVEEYWAWMKTQVDAANSILDGKKIDVPLLVPRFTRLLAQTYELAEQLAKNTRSHWVGDSLMKLLRKGAVPADVHLGNVGVFETGNCNQGVYKIFDIGHCLILRKKYSEIELPMIGDGK